MNTTPTDLAVATASEPESRHPFLLALGERVREQRARRGMTRKAVALAADVRAAPGQPGIRHGQCLHPGAAAGGAGPAVRAGELLGDVTTSSPEWLLIRELLAGRGEAELRQARETLGHLFQDRARRGARGTRIALIGLRGRASPRWGGGWPRTWATPSSS
jgi:XRE family aerobic/anaerobic benzoate catabolism transcriptional regulator